MENQIQRSIKDETNETAETMMNITSSELHEKSRNDYIKILLLIEMYKGGDEIILDGYFRYQDHSATAMAKGACPYGINGVIGELQNAKSEQGAFYLLSRCGSLARQVLDYMLEYLESQQKENDHELFSAYPDSAYCNDGYTNRLRDNYHIVLATYLNMLSATVIKQRLYIAELTGEEMEPIRAKENFLPEIEKKVPSLTE